MRDKKGFTLIEISIVLVIIGLIVGGILIGRELISAAEIRATISQIAKYNTSVNTFRSKYGYLPGDLPAARAAALEFFADSSPQSGLIGHQDGNGLLQGGQGGGRGATGENTIFWRHLSDARMINGSYGTTASGNPLMDDGTPTEFGIGKVYQVLPPAKLGISAYFAVFSLDGFNYYQLAGISYFDTATLEYVVDSNALRPIEAQSLDAKMDDGLPGAGSVREGIWLNNYPPTSSGINCAAANQYVLTYEAPACALSLRFQ